MVGCGGLWRVVEKQLDVEMVGCGMEVVKNGRVWSKMV